MTNYGEEIVYWYLRFNGFFPMNNFVIHRTETRDTSSDADIIAVRFPNVVEEIGGQSDDWDNELFNLFSSSKPLSLKSPIGVICEVKTGKNFGRSANDVESLFKYENLSYVIGRFGFTKKYNDYVSSVDSNALITTSKFQIAKVLFSDKEKLNDSKRFFHIPLSKTKIFLHHRITKYKKEKYQDRLFFPSNLMQYMIDTA